jgi:D-alanyl-D-alanine carboxypeptidase
MTRIPIRALAILLLALLLGAGSLAAQQELPDSPAGRQAGALIETIGQTGDASIRAFVEERMNAQWRRIPMEQHLQVFRGVRQNLQGVQIVSLTESSPHELELLLAGSGGRARIFVTVEASPPHLISRLRVQPEAAPPAVSRFDTFDALDRHLSEAAANDRFSGVVLASRGDDVVFHRAYGQADREAGVPVRPDTRFDLGSIDKAFTQVAILRLAQEGRLGLDDAVGDHLAGLSPGLAAATIRQLLQHRAGAGNYLADPAFQSDPARYGTVAALLALIRDRDPDFEPGTSQRYSNSGFVLLGAVVEALTGRPYHAVIREWVLEPAGMTDTGPEGRDRSPNTAVPYTRGQRGPEAPLARSTFGTVATPAGGGFSTAEDLRRFLRALGANRLLDARHTDMLVNEYAELGTRDTHWGIAGGAPGINAVAGIEFARDHVVVVLTNLDPPVAESLGPVLLLDLPDS